MAPRVAGAAGACGVCVAGLLALAAVLATAAPRTPAVAVVPAQRLGVTEAVVAVDRGNAVVAGVRRGRVVLTRLDARGRPLAWHVLGRSHGASDLRVALAGSRVAVAWLDHDDALVLMRTRLRARNVQRDRLAGRGILFHELAMNARGVVVDEFKDSPDGDDSGVSVYRARPGHAARRVTILAPTSRNPNAGDVEVDGTGRFHVSWADGELDPDAELGTADADARGTFGPASGQELGSNISGLEVRTARDGGQLAAYQRQQHDGGPFLLMASRRPPGGRWQTPAMLASLGTGYRIHELAIAPGGDGLVVYDSSQYGGLLRGILLPAGGSPRAVQLGRGVLEGVVADALGRARVLVSRFDRHAKFQVTTVALASGRVDPAPVLVRNCFGEPDQERGGRFASDARGRLAAVLVCGRGQRPAVARVPAPAG